MRTLQELVKYFGTNEAKAYFLQLCLRYKRAYYESVQAEIAQKESYAPRAETHNKIMDIVTRLFLQHPTIQSKFGVQPDRFEMRKLILEAPLELLGEKG